jgi:DNA-directed RNA polymerase beta subunit
MSVSDGFNVISCVYALTHKQVLNRLTYASALSHLRRLNTPLGREGKQVGKHDILHYMILRV